MAVRRPNNGPPGEGSFTWRGKHSNATAAARGEFLRLVAELAPDVVSSLYSGVRPTFSRLIVEQGRAVADAISSREEDPLAVLKRKSEEATSAPPFLEALSRTWTHDYKRHGTTTLFAALDLATGHIIRECMPKHRHQEFLAFMRKVVRTVPKPLAIHVILDNYQTHKHPAVKAWLARNPRVHFHVTPTSASWLNLVERFFSELTERQLRRLAVTSVGDLIDAITRYIDERNQNPKPFAWTASVRQILTKVNKAKQTLATLH